MNFFQIVPFIRLARNVSRSGGVCMVEAAGVEPHCAVHLFASPCIYRSLSAFNDISKIGGNASRCS